MNIGIVGFGFVGKTVSACFANLGHPVTAVDIDDVTNPATDVYEENLRNLLKQHTGSLINTTTCYSKLEDSDIIFITLPTPTADDGSADLSAVKDGIYHISPFVDDETTVVVKSTVPPTTTEEIIEPELKPASVVVNPEFLREGSSVSDFRNPDKIVIGGESDKLRKLYEPFDYNDMIITGKREAEMIKYANNVFLATKISTINELGNICKELGIDTYDVADAVGSDSRICRDYMDSGVGFGGSCLPKDVRAVQQFTDDYDADLLESILRTNKKQPKRAVDLLSDRMCIDGKTVSVLGLSFKPDTRDTRNSQSFEIIDELQNQGANVLMYDPAVTGEDGQNIVDSSDAVIVATGWNEFKQFDYSDIDIVIDCCRILDDAVGLTW